MRQSTMFSCSFAALFAAPLVANAGVIGDPNDMYVTSDAHSEVYQFERTSPWAHVPGNYVGGLGGSYSQVFSNSTQLSSNAPYLGAVAGNNQDFFIGGFGSLQKIDSATGASLGMIGAAGSRLGPAQAPNDNIVVGGPTGIEEFDSNTGAFVRTVNGVGDGGNLFTFKGDEMFVANWFGGSGFGIQRYSFTTGAVTGATIPVPFGPQEIGIGPDGALYATALYEGPGVEGLWRYDFGAGTWSQYIDVQFLAGGGPHGFTFDPINFDIYMAFNSGEIYRFDQSGAFLNLANFVPTKLTDILFKRTVPEPGALTLLLAGSGLAIRRRRRA
ncbi:MAG: PEP-CTERM sorting domain-containing protein [Phycisphaeraceae bacterium]|nr:PEP-CTERM sorting domain-containing protein [Phycisphaeraceae bacterium]MCB9848830.1 PEP-CTERM sorting domain-containing protein [Phycisphaeraceae bacterium]